MLFNKQKEWQKIHFFKKVCFLCVIFLWIWGWAHLCESALFFAIKSEWSEIIKQRKTHNLSLIFGRKHYLLSFFNLNIKKCCIKQMSDFITEIQNQIVLKMCVFAVDFLQSSIFVALFCSILLLFFSFSILLSFFSHLSILPVLLLSLFLLLSRVNRGSFLCSLLLFGWPPVPGIHKPLSLLIYAHINCPPL